jgi:hypothetical protein
VEDTGFKLWYTGNTSTKNDVGIVLNKSLKDEVVDIKRQVDMIILVRLLVGDRRKGKGVVREERFEGLVYHQGASIR